MPRHNGRHHVRYRDGDFIMCPQDRIEILLFFFVDAGARHISVLLLVCVHISFVGPDGGTFLASSVSFSVVMFAAN